MQQPTYRKSSYSGSSNDACVEVADNLPQAVMVRDSKHMEEVGPELRASRPAWSTFISSVK
ncbi:DUF397 domain-containing protein [Streptomyces sp. NPDC058861]|uniref:DUF397 domain-containing protein n=1 Tax=Streptomyces sp. NPDC058861 TaxID=3346653 RepID=UPI0036961A74